MRRRRPRLLGRPMPGTAMPRNSKHPRPMTACRSSACWRRWRLDMRELTVAITQMASANDWAKNCDKAEGLARDAAKQGANLVLLQELFDGDYFCIEQHAQFFTKAHEIDRHPTVARFTALAKELGVVLPVCVFERARNAHYNTVVMVDADGSQLGIYRKSHIPDGRGYQEKFYFSPG